MRLSDLKIYRWLMGGRWYFYKLGVDTPNINLFTAWLRESPNEIDMNFCTLLHIENYKG